MNIKVQINTWIIIIDCIHSPFKSEALWLEWYRNTSSNSRATIKGEGDYKVNHRGVHFGPYNCSQVMYRNNGHTISSATYQRMISTTCWIARLLEINRGRVTYKCDIFTFTDPDSPYSRATIRWGITVLQSLSSRSIRPMVQWNDYGYGVILWTCMVKDHCCNSTANTIVTSITYCSHINTPLWCL